MADKHTSDRTFTSVDASILLGQVMSLASKRLDALCEESRREKAAKILRRRRKKWRKRHKLLCLEVQGGINDGLQDEKERFEETAEELTNMLVKRRDQGLVDAMQLQTQESLHSLEVFQHRLANENTLLQSYISHIGNISLDDASSAINHQDHVGLIKDVEATISQVEALAEIRKMKLAMTPRLPQLQNRTLSGNILEQSLGILHDSMLDGNGISTELLDSEHAHLQIIGKEVSISQEESEAVVTAEVSSAVEENEKRRENGNAVGDERKAEEVPACSPEKLSSDETPGIGMEVICAEGSSELSSSEKEGDVQLAILRLFQDSRYDLRFPVQRYSNQASRDKKKPSPSDRLKKWRSCRKVNKGSPHLQPIGTKRKLTSSSTSAHHSLL